jgi:hypothetical protein
MLELTVDRALGRQGDKILLPFCAFRWIVNTDSV